MSEDEPVSKEEALRRHPSNEIRQYNQETKRDVKTVLLIGGALIVFALVHDEFYNSISGLLGVDLGFSDEWWQT